VINLEEIRSRWQLAAPFLDERGRRLFAANEALALGFGGVTATAMATGIARSTIIAASTSFSPPATTSTGGCAVPVPAARAR
jgi:predicted dienelactone hydrolase